MTDKIDNLYLNWSALLGGWMIGGVGMCEMFLKGYSGIGHRTVEAGVDVYLQATYAY